MRIPGPLPLPIGLRCFAGRIPTRAASGAHIVVWYVLTETGYHPSENADAKAAFPQAFADNQADEILAFYDLGSAKMNLEMAIEMSDKKVHLYDTAFLEGAYTAASLIQAGVNLEDIEKQLKPLTIKD